MVLRVAFPYLTSAAAVAWMLGTGLAAAVEPAAPVPPAPVPTPAAQAGPVQSPAPVPPAAVEPARRETTAAPEPLSSSADAPPLPVGPIKPGAAPRMGETRPVEGKPAEARQAEPQSGEGRPAAKKVSRELPPLVVARMSQDTTPTLTPATFLDTLRAASATKAWSRPAAGRRCRPTSR